MPGRFWRLVLLTVLSCLNCSLDSGELMGINPPAWGTAVPDTLQFGPRDYVVRRVKVDAVIDKVPWPTPGLVEWLCGLVVYTS